MKTFESFVWRLVLAAILAAVVYLYYSIVLPRVACAALALVAGVAEVLAPMVSKGGQGISLRLLAMTGTTLLAWPALAWLLHLYIADRVACMALAAAVASLGGLFAAGHGQGREHRRLAAILVSVLVPLYAIAYALAAGSRGAVAFACLAVGVAFFVAKIAEVWPDRIEESLAVGGTVAILAGAATIAVAFV